MSLEEFKAYVTSSGVIFDGLSSDEKRLWGESFDKSRIVAPAGESPSNIISIQQ
jgi:hypothetical protein